MMSKGEQGKGSWVCWAPEPTEVGGWCLSQFVMKTSLSKEGLDELMIAGMWAFPTSTRTAW